MPDLKERLTSKSDYLARCIGAERDFLEDAVHEARTVMAEAAARIEELEAGLAEAAHIFRVYAEMHDNKGTADGRKKARRNMEHAERFEALLSQPHTSGEQG